MPKYIDADKLIKKLIAEKEHYMERGHGDGGINMIIASIENAPPAEVAPVVHGQWKVDRDSYYLYCTECLCTPTRLSNYCPNCGAKMDKK